MRARTPSAEPLGHAWLDDHVLRFHKHGVDGSGKCDIVPAAGERVHGVLYRLEAGERPLLDRAEGLGVGYRHARVQVLLADGSEREALCYRALQIADDLPPYDWYLQHVLGGAREHGLPADYIAGLAAVPCIPDPDRARALRETALHA